MTHIKKWLSVYKAFCIVLCIKVVASLFFSSGFKDDLFLPFISHFLTVFDNPWEHFYLNPGGAQFPYHPIMLYIFSFFYAPFVWLGLENQLLSNFLFKLPLYISDIVITATLIRFFPRRKQEIFWFYFVSPIVIYASYLHTQVDSVTTAFLFLTLYSLYQKRPMQGGLWFGVALATKLHVFICLPLLVIYILKQFRWSDTLRFLACVFGIYTLNILPYAFEPGFIELVLANPKQSMMFHSAISLGGTYSIYTTVAILMLAVFKFGMYRKTNIDLLFSFLVILFSIPVLLVLPQPGWYLWAVPFMSIFLIKASEKKREVIYLYAGFNAMYILFFLFFFKSDIISLSFMGYAIPPAFTHGIWPNLIFTTLEMSLLCLVIAFYQYGVRSNDIYKRTQSIVIGIGGDSGSGKTTLLQDITSLMPQKTVALESDGIHKWERGNKEWESHTHLDPKANHLHSFFNQISQLKRGLTTPFRFYNHESGTFTKPNLIQSKDIILLSGLHPFYLPIMRKIVDVKIFLATNDALRCFWKIKRDMSHRGYSLEAIQAQLKKREAESLKHINSQKRFADILVEYYTHDDLTNFNLDVKDINLKLSVTCSSDIYLEPFVDTCQAAGILESWDYLDDLRFVKFEFNGPLESCALNRVVKDTLANAHDIISPSITWSPGYRGIIQFFIVAFISERMKEYD
ncbi:hypothetical protein HOG98_03525 [bacterium]|nr:hypothetical protein [bacterium]